MLNTRRLQFDFDLPRRGYGGVGAVERPIGEGGADARPNTEQNQRCVGASNRKRRTSEHVLTAAGGASG